MVVSNRLGSLQVDVIADLKKYKGGLSRAKKDAKKAGSLSGRAFSKGFGAATAKLQAIKFKALAGVAAVTSFVFLAKRAAEAADEIGKTADKLGVTTTELQRFRFAAGIAGVAISGLDNSILKFSRGIGETGNGIGEAKRSFDRLGISVKHSDGRFKSAGRLLGEVADAMRKVKSPTEKVQIAMDLFGRSGAGMINMLRDGSKGLQEMGDRMEALGI